jgi:hypothetical protein
VKENPLRPPPTPQSLPQLWNFPLMINVTSRSGNTFLRVGNTFPMISRTFFFTYLSNYKLKAISSVAQLFLDETGVVFAAKPRQPKSDWLDTIDRIEKRFLELKAALDLEGSKVRSKRGDFPSITFGITHGQGKLVSHVLFC